MTLTQFRAGRLLALALLCFAPANGVSASPVSPFTLVGSKPVTLTAAALQAAQKSVTPCQPLGGRTLTFPQKSVRLVAVTGPENDMLSYRIGGVRNPALILAPGTTVKMLFVNTDDDMPHNVRFGAVPSAYPNLMTAYDKSSIGTSEIAHKSGNSLHGEELTFRAPAKPGVYAYFCTVRGHAQSGMTGKVIVQPGEKTWKR